MKIHFHGGVDTVTGSQHIVEANGQRVLRDCGLYQGRRKEAETINRSLPFRANSIHSVVLSHAHVDHCGNLPTLVKNGFEGPIYTTTATLELCGIMLRDAAKIQEQDASYLNQKTNRKGMEPVIPLYTMLDAEAVMPHFKGFHYGDEIVVAPGIHASFHEAGHILGAALSVFTVEEAGRRLRIGFAIDLGRKDLPMIRDPELLKDLDALVIESTYGDRLHAQAEKAEDQLYDAIKKTIDRGGKVIIPSFALERAQEIIYHLSSLISQRKLPKIPVYVDSPMAAAVSKVFEMNYDYLDDEIRALSNIVGSAIEPPWVHFSSSVEESKAITSSTKPSIVISASGMCEHGRILHHLKHGIENPLNTILIVGFQAQFTLGRRLVDQETKVKIFGDWFERKAEVVVLDAFSAHADRTELMDYIQRSAPKSVYLVHGETDQRKALYESLLQTGMRKVYMPAKGETVTL
ncbi:MAG: MBL fold metallo-hydrolase [Lentisphaerota bacterium]